MSKIIEYTLVSQMAIVSGLSLNRSALLRSGY